MVSRRRFSLMLLGAVWASHLWSQSNLDCEMHPTGGELAIPNFSRYEVTQGPDQCWAACIQMFLNYRGVSTNQADLAKIVKGSSDIVESATEKEIQTAIQKRAGWFKDQATGEPWTLDFLPIPRATPAVIRRYLCESRPILGVLESKSHVVVIYKANFSARGPNILTLTYYDPAVGRDVPIYGRDIPPTFSSLWLLTAARTQDRRF